MGRQTLIILLAIVVLFGVADAAPNVSRTSGVAPLYVHFDADVAASSGATRPFHDYDYSWNFGDLTSGTWGTSNKSKNTDKGPVAAHVYETAGTYTATLTVRNPSDGSTVGSPSNFTITVTDPNTVFSGTKTTCISTGSDFTGCPSGAAQVTTSSLSGLPGYTDAGERVLLKRGDTWTLNASPSWVANNGPVSIGAFGTCSSPDAETGVCSNAPQVTLGSGASGGFLNAGQMQDWRLADIYFYKSHTSNTVVTGGQDMRHILVHKIKSYGGSTFFMYSNFRESDDEYNDAIAMSQCFLDNYYDFPVFVGAERLALIGNKAQNSTTDHIFRVWLGYKLIVAHNILSGSASDKHNLKYHGPTLYGESGQEYVGTYAQVGGTMGGGMRNRSQFAVIANNVFGRGGAQPVSIGPQNDSYNERVTDVIFEKNRIITGYGSGAAPNSGTVIHGGQLSVRNNVYDMTSASTDGLEIILMEKSLATVAPDRISIFNNTLYSNTSIGNSVSSIRVYPNCTNIIARNNLHSFPNVVDDWLINDSTGNITESNNVTTNNAYFTDPNNATPLARSFALTANSTMAIDDGTTVGVRDDFLGNLRYPLTGTAYDVGAYEYGASGESEPSATGTAIGAGTMAIGAGTMSISTQ